MCEYHWARLCEISAQKHENKYYRQYNQISVYRKWKSQTNLGKQLPNTRGEMASLN